MRLLNLQRNTFAYNRMRIKKLPKFYQDKEMKPMKYKNMADVLYQSEYQDKKHNIIKQTAEFFAENRKSVVSNDGMAHIIYNSAKQGLHYKEIYNTLEEKLQGLRGEFSKRQIVGCMYGLIRSNCSSQYAYRFFISELQDSFAFLTYKELLDLFEACSYNTNLDRLDLDHFMMVLVYDGLMKHKKKIIHNDMLIIELIKAMERKDLYPRKHLDCYKGFEGIDDNIKLMWELLITSFGKLNRIKNSEKLIKNYEFFKRVESENKLHRSIEPELKNMREKMDKRVDLTWRYNIEEARLYSYKELKARRNDYQYVADEDAPWEKQQWMTMYEPCQVQILKEWRNKRMIEQGLIKKDREIKDLEEEVDELIKKTFDQQISQKYDQKLDGIDQDIGIDDDVDGSGVDESEILSNESEVLNDESEVLSDDQSGSKKP